MAALQRAKSSRKMLPEPKTLPATMRLIARMMLLLTLVLGVSVALAWAWDNSDDLAARQAETGVPAR